MTSHDHAELCRRVLACIARAQAHTTPTRYGDAEWVDLCHRAYCENKALAKEWIDRLTVAARQEAKDGWEVKAGWWWLHGEAVHAIDPRTRMPLPPDGIAWPPKRISEMVPNRAARPYRRRKFDAEAWVAMMEQRYPPLDKSAARD